jgi:hypothetical protein
MATLNTTQASLLRVLVDRGEVPRREWGGAAWQDACGDDLRALIRRRLVAEHGGCYLSTSGGRAALLEHDAAQAPTPDAMPDLPARAPQRYIVPVSATVAQALYLDDRAMQGERDILVRGGPLPQRGTVILSVTADSAGVLLHDLEERSERSDNPDPPAWTRACRGALPKVAAMLASSLPAGCAAQVRAQLLRERAAGVS